MAKTLTKFVGKLPTNCLSVFDHFVKLALKGLRKLMTEPLSRKYPDPTEQAQEVIFSRKIK